MDHCVIADYWEEEIHGIDNSNCYSSLWTTVSVSGQVSAWGCSESRQHSKYGLSLYLASLYFSLLWDRLKQKLTDQTGLIFRQIIPCNHVAMYNKNCTDCVYVWCSWVCHWFYPSNWSIHP